MIDNAPEIEAVRKILSLGEALELSASRIYHSLCLIFKDDPEKSSFFHHLAVEEEAHAEFFRFHLSMLGRAPSAFTPVEGLKKELEGILKSLETIEREVERTDVSFKRALEIVFEIESSVLEGELMERMTFHSESLKKNFSGILDETKGHKGRVVTFAKKYGIDFRA